MNKKAVVKVLSGFLILVLILNLIGGYFIYIKWYIPKQAKQFIEVTLNDFNKINLYIDQLKTDINMNYPEKNLSLANELAEQFPFVMITSPIVVRYDYTSTLELIESSLDITDKLKNDILLVKKNLPKDTNYSNKISSNLSNYYQDIDEFNNRYHELRHFMYEYTVALEPLYEIIYDEKFDINSTEIIIELQKNLDDLDKIATNQDTDKIKTETENLLNGYLDYYTILSQNDNTNEQINVTLNKFAQQVGEFNLFIENENNSLREDFLDSLKSIEDKKTQLEDQFEILKDKYNYNKE